MNIIEHAEKFLGNISHGWKEKPSSEGLQVLLFENSPFEAVDTFMTAGLSHHELKISNQKMVRQELIFPVSGTAPAETFVSLLLFICELILRNHNAVLRGQVIRLPMEAAEKLGFDALYCSLPVFMDDEFAKFGESQPSTIIVWMMPIHKSEADYIDANGWSNFEDLLEKEDPDLFSLGRKAII